LNAVETAFNNEKPVLAVIHRNSNHPFILKTKERNDVSIFEISPENRDSLHNEILDILEKIKK
jgi:nucleoside-triphosphatase